METIVVSRKLSWKEIYERLASAPPGRLYGIPRGGAIVAGLTGRAVDRIEDADWIVDDVIDTGSTKAQFTSVMSKPVWGLFDRERDQIGDRSLTFPWQANQHAESRQTRLERIGEELLETLGYDPKSPGLHETPHRWANWWREFLDFDAGRTETHFEAVSSDQLITVSGLRIWSVCEHHLLPFSVDVAIGYVPSSRILGLSKFARLAHSAGHRLQLQERLANDIADEVQRLTDSKDVAVLIRGRHLCMESRGIRTAADVGTLIVRGAFRADEGLRKDFFSLTQRQPAANGEVGSSFEPSR